jgi:hypothetical protein
MSAAEVITPGPNVDDALALARHGLYNFPCQPRGKKPLTSNGLHDATIDEAEIRARFEKWPNQNIAIRTGAISGVFVLDVDAKSGGLDILAKLEAEHGKLPPTPCVRTGGGGLHFYFAHPGGKLGNTAGKIGLGIDTRGDGGYVIAPPSVHESGASYEWEDIESDLAPAPQWLLDLLAASTKHEPKANTAVATVTPSNGTTDHADGALRNLVAEVKGAPEGTRNQTLFHAAARMGEFVAGGQITEPEVVAALTDAARSAGLDDREIHATIRSGLTAGARQPEYPERSSSPSTKVTSNGSLASDPKPSGAAEGSETEDDKTDESTVEPKPNRCLTFKPLDIWADEYQEPAWRIREFLMRDALDVIGGAEKSLKSWLLLHCALAVTAGVPLFGHEPFDVPEPGPVLLLTGEGGVDLVHDRARHLCKMYGVPFERVARDLIVTADIATMTSGGFAESITAAIDTYDPVLVQLDPLYVYFGEDRDAGNVYSTGPAIHELRRLCGGRALQVAHHFTKAGADRLTLSSLTQAGMREAVDHWLLVSVNDYDLAAQRFVLDMVRGARRGFGWTQRAEFVLGRFDPITLRHEGTPSVAFTTKAEQVDHELRACAVLATRAVKKHREECEARGDEVTGVSQRWIEEQIKGRKGGVQRKRAAIEEAALRGALRTEPGPNRSTLHFYVRDYPLPGEGGLVE